MIVYFDRHNFYVCRTRSSIFSQRERSLELKGIHVQHPAMAIHQTTFLYGSVTDCPWITTVLYLSGTYMDQWSRITDSLLDTSSSCPDFGGCQTRPGNSTGTDFYCNDKFAPPFPFKDESLKIFPKKKFFDHDDSKWTDCKLLQ